MENNITDDVIKWDWEHEFQILEEEVPLQMADYMFKYIIGFGGMLIDKREIQRTDHPFRWKARYNLKKYGNNKLLAEGISAN